MNTVADKFMQPQIQYQTFTLSDAVAASAQDLFRDMHMHVLHRDDVKILSALARARRTILQYELEQDPRVGLSRRTVCKRLKRLRAAGLTCRPNGERGGEAITEAGCAELRADAMVGAQ